MKRFLLFILPVFAIALVAGIFFSASRKPATPQSSQLTTNTLTSPQPAPPSPSPVTQPIKLLFGGDLMFDRHIRQHIDQNGVDFVFRSLKPLFEEYDAIVANLEGPVTSFPSKSINSAVGSTNNFLFTFDPKILPMLKQNQFTILNLGNNHINNFGREGVAQTKKNLKMNDLNFFGNTNNETTSAERIYLKTDTTPTLAFVNYNQFVPDGLATAIQDVKAAKKLAELVIVMPHWGNEYQLTANEVVQADAHQLINAGADLIIGGHPHVIEQREDYKGRTIYYSLGNFVFDQYFEPDVQKGLLVGVEIYPDKTFKFTEYSIQLLKTGETQLLPHSSP